MKSDCRKTDVDIINFLNDKYSLQFLSPSETENKIEILI